MQAKTSKEVTDRQRSCLFLLTWEDQKRKLALVVETAKKVWG